MAGKDGTAQQDVVVGFSDGLHARAATIIAEAASHFDEEILLTVPEGLEFEDEPVDAASALMVMSLGAEHGDTVSVSSINATAVEKIARIIEVGYP